MKVLRLLNDIDSNQVGDVAGFSDNKAAYLIKNKFAVLYIDDSEKKIDSQPEKEIKKPAVKKNSYKKTAKAPKKAK